MTVSVMWISDGKICVVNLVHKFCEQIGGNHMQLPSGLYEELISEALHQQLTTLQQYESESQKIDAEEASLILSKYTGRVIQRALKVVRERNKKSDAIKDQETLAEQVRLCNELIEILAKLCDHDDLLTYRISQQHEMLLSLYLKINSVRAFNPSATITRPETPLSESSLFTGASVEPNMVNEIKKEILTCDLIDIEIRF
jgi:hypothetical protein